MARNHGTGTQEKSLEMKIGILGCGWLGKKLAQCLLADAHEVYTSNTRASKAQELVHMGCQSYVVDFLSDDIDMEIAQTFQSLDYIVMSVAVSRRAAIERQEKMFGQVIQFLEGYVGNTVLFTTTGIYPQENQRIKENTYRDNQLHPTVRTVEKIIQGGLPQTNILRLSGLLGADRIMSHWFHEVSQISNPDDPVNHVHYEDVIAIVKKLMQSDIRGDIFNVTAPEHPTKKEVFLGKSTQITHASKHRIIDGSKLENKLPYTYIHQDPIHFK
ncbi:hypothetical protein GO491_09410 [Flavobacteriaceae bacterium Ap0902]|nr:hypothetical protein [Flavobacteriaceae bacterium Ap0902]